LADKDSLFCLTPDDEKALYEFILNVESTVGIEGVE